MVVAINIVQDESTAFVIRKKKYQNRMQKVWPVDMTSDSIWVLYLSTFSSARSFRSRESQVTTGWLFFVFLTNARFFSENGATQTFKDWCAAMKMVDLV